MSFLGNLFPGESHSKNERSPFEKWGPPPQISDIPSGRLSLPSLSDENRFISAAFGPSILIGLGSTGHAVLQQWLDQTTYYDSGSFDCVRILSIVGQELPQLVARSIRTHQISLEKPGKKLDAFLEAVTLRRFYDWLRIALLDMRDIQVLIIGSVADPEMQILGILLQILRTFPTSGDSPYLNISALLTLSSSDKRQDISNGEKYAALREAGRFTFNGLHKTVDLPNSSEIIFRSALLDHLFLFDNDTLGGNDDFYNGLAQALSEIVFFLNHPCSKVFWETLKNNPTGELRQRHHQPFVHAFGVRTLFMPVSEMRSYLSMRLAHAVLFGERPQDNADKFIPSLGVSVISDSVVDALAHRWLNDAGPGSHPIFEWLWTIHPASQMVFPEIGDGFYDLYAFKVSYNLASFLNDPSRDDRLRIAELVLRAHVQLFDELLSTFGVADDLQPVGRANLAHMLRRWRQTAEILRHSLENWQKALLLSPILPSAQTSDSSLPRIRLNWKDGRSSLSASQQTVYQIVQRLQTQSEENLLKIKDGRVRSALIHSSIASLGEVEKYYSDTIRPELSHMGLPAGKAFQSVRNRLEWWVRLLPLHDPELVIICWPSQVNITAGARPAPEYCYRSDDLQNFVDAVVSLCSTQSGGYDDLTGEWFERRLRAAVSEVHGKTENVFLSYDENFTVSMGDNRDYYLAAKNKALTGGLLKDIFPMRISADVHEMGDYDPTRFSALISRFGIPFSAVEKLNHWYPAYNHSPQFHSCAPEKIAAAYESRILRSRGSKVLLSPDFVLMLSDQQLITLFCQALFVKLIRLENVDMAASAWSVLPLGGFDSLSLGTGSMLEAFRKFMLEIPNDPATRLNPQKHFHPSRRSIFLSTLHKEARSIRHGVKFKALYDEFKNGPLVIWKNYGDSLSASFADLLQTELEEPFWDGWYL